MKNHRNVGQVLRGALEPVKPGTERAPQGRVVLVQYALHFLRRARQNDAVTTARDGFIGVVVVTGLCSQHKPRDALGRNREAVNCRIFLNDHAAPPKCGLPNAEQPHVVRHPGLVNAVQKILV